MIEFITLFLGGLVTGPRAVELMAAEKVAVVEVHLDGELTERLESPPWRLEVDFGNELVPHVLEVVALDASEAELGRASQWINFAAASAQTSVMIDGADRGEGAVARISWQSLAEMNEPQTTVVHFDGQPLPVTDPRSVELPRFDPDQTHHLQIRLEFSDELFSEADAVFGGVYGSSISSEISAVPIWFTKGNKPQTTRSMDDWFLVDNQAGRVQAFEQGPAEIIFVRDVATETDLRQLDMQASRLDTDIRLRKDYRLSLISPCPQLQRRSGFRQLVYPRTQRFSSRDGTLIRLLAWVNPVDCSERNQQLADAIGIAGLTAVERGQRRIVVLLLSDRPQDHSHYSPQQMIRYLERLRVPLVIWRFGPTGRSDAPWGQATDVRKLGRLDKAFNLIEKGLERQLIVWLEGLHLPQSVELRPGVEGVSLVE